MNRTIIKTGIELANNSKVVNATRHWIANFVIRLNICPFAGHPFEKELIAYEVYDGSNAEKALTFIADQLKCLEDVAPSAIETTLIIFPGMLHDFLAYMDFLGLAESLLIDMKLEGIIQIASFHPRYQFDGTEVNDLSNYSNRSPYPMIHLLREDSVHAATHRHPDISSIPQRNIDLLQSMSSDELKNHLK